MPKHKIAPSNKVSRNGGILLSAMILTFVLLRVYLHNSPNTDLNVGRYNIHHLFTGLLLITAGAIPLAILKDSTHKLDLACWTLGAGLGMALDEWVFLIATDGSNASYLLPVSFWGGAVMIGLACAYAATLIFYGRREIRKSGDDAAP